MRHSRGSDLDVLRLEEGLDERAAHAEQQIEVVIRQQPRKRGGTRGFVAARHALPISPPISASPTAPTMRPTRASRCSTSRGKSEDDAGPTSTSFNVSTIFEKMNSLVDSSEFSAKFAYREVETWKRLVGGRRRRAARIR